MWDGYGLPQNLGTTVFWYFIVPKILEMLKIVGCEYVFLFAADLTPYEELIRYYSDQLKFERQMSIVLPFRCMISLVNL